MANGCCKAGQGAELLMWLGRVFSSQAKAASTAPHVPAPGQPLLVN